MVFRCKKYPKLTVVNGTGYIKFRKGEYRTEDKKEIALLKTVKDVIVVE